MEETARRRELLISRGWVQAVLLVVLFGFFVLGLLAYRTYDAEAADPGPRRSSPPGATLFTGDDVREGQKVFLRNGLMEYGSIFGHGAYLGPDFTADYLRRAALVRQAPLRRRELGSRARQTHDADFRINRYDDDTGTLELHRAAGARRSGSCVATTATSSASRRPSTACARRRSPIRARSAS